MARADEFGTEVDLTTFAESRQQEQPSVWDDVHIQDVGLFNEGTGRRFYISGMLGPSFAGLFAGGNAPSEAAILAPPSTHATSVAAGGAMGVAFDRRNGRLRVETEGMGRSTYFGPGESFNGITVGLLTASNWSVMENVWRDVMFNDGCGAYGGGGIGAGGYRWGLGTRGQVNESLYYPKAASAFAWQFGGGPICEFTDRLTCDVGYRYFHINPVTLGNSPTNFTFAASELMFTLRLYEPFRGLTR